MTIARPDNLSDYWANGASTTYVNDIPVNAPVDPQLASFELGFPPITMTPIASGGLPPFGQDMNGILKVLSEHTRFQNSGGVYRFDSALATILGGYDAGTVLQSNDGKSAYVSAVNANLNDFNSDPSSIGVTWLPYNGLSFNAANRFMLNKTDNSAAVIVDQTLANQTASSSPVNLPTVQGSFAGHPSNAKAALCLLRCSLVAGGETAYSVVQVRKNSSESWQSKLFLEPSTTTNPAVFSVTNDIYLPVVFDTTTNKADFRVVYNFQGNSAPNNYGIHFVVELDSYYI